MRYTRATLVAGMATAALLAPSAALAQVDSLSVSGGRLGPEGATVVVDLTYQCDVSYNAAFGNVSVAQSTGHKLAQGSGFFFNDFPGQPCTGSPQTREVVVSTFTSFAFKQGRATATSFSLSVFNPATFDFVTETGGPVELRIRKK